MIDFDRLSPFEQFAILPETQQQKVLSAYSDDQLMRLEWDWNGWLARPAQRIPAGAWIIWLILTGRGWGKTRTGAETVYQWVRDGYTRIALVGRTVPDVRDTMIGYGGKGESGIMNVGPWPERPEYNAQQRAIYFPARKHASVSHPDQPTKPMGAVGTMFTAEKPAQLRGPQHEKAWIDELAQFQYEEAWDNLLLGLRLGDNPQCVVTTTPRRVPMIRSLLKDPTVHLTTGTTYDNLQNLADAFRLRVITRYEGTRLGRQELHGAMLEDVVGALWTSALIEKHRVQSYPANADGTPKMYRVVVAIDPQSIKTKAELAQSQEHDDEGGETGIVVAGIDVRGQSYVLEDVTLNGSPHEWASAAIAAYYRWHADRIVGEINNGGDMVGYTVGTVDPSVPFSEVWASKGKYTRAEPISALYERGYVHHVGLLAMLEDELTTWVPGDKSPNRLDACVWALSELFYPQKEQQGVVTQQEERPISPV